MNFHLGAAVGTANISEGFLEGTFTLYAVQGLPPTECALLAMTERGWRFIRATDGPLEWGGTYRTAREALAVLGNVLVQGYIDALVTRQDPRTRAITRSLLRQRHAARLHSLRPRDAHPMHRRPHD